MLYILMRRKARFFWQDERQNAEGSRNTAPHVCPVVGARKPVS